MADDCRRHGLYVCIGLPTSWSPAELALEHLRAAECPLVSVRVMAGCQGGWSCLMCGGHGAGTVDVDRVMLGESVAVDDTNRV